MIAVGQGRFATELGDGMLAAVGPERHAWLYRQRSLLDAGLVLPGSSDRPVVTGAPLLGIHDMVEPAHRHRRAVQRGRGGHPEPRRCAPTPGAPPTPARPSTPRARSTPGKLADFAVLSEDPTAVSPGRIAGLEVIATFIDGDLRYDGGISG